MWLLVAVACGGLADVLIRSWLARRGPALSRELAVARHDAMTDEVTGLANRRGLHARLEQALGEGDGRVALLLLDLDGFQDINDTLGHAAGDLVLCEVARRLEHVALDTDLLARIGGDEFAILMSGAATRDATHVARRVRARMEQTIAVDGLRVRLGTAMGLALAPDHAATAVELGERADVALRLAKARRTSIEVYTAAAHPRSRARLTLTADLPVAIARDQLEVHFQPQADARTGAVVGAEALVRWRHPEHGLMPPEAFLPLAERAGLMGPLAVAVLDQAIRACVGWRAAGHDLSVAVNLSVTNLQDPDLPGDIADLLRDADLEPQHLEVEITEEVVMADAVVAIDVLHELKALGVRVSLDDFGTGYSSMAYLKDLAVDALKVDRSFVRDMAASREDAAIVRSIVALAHTLDLTVVAEGVPSAATLAAVCETGCDAAQGFHLGAPMPAREFAGWLDAHAQQRAA